MRRVRQVADLEEEARLFAVAPAVEETLDPAPQVESPPPPSMPVSRPRAVSEGIVFLTPSAHDLDRLWDWIRHDGPARMAEWGVETSRDLYAQVEAYLHAEISDGVAWFRSVYLDGVHVGVAYLFPKTPALGVVHALLDPSVRPHGLTLLRQLVRAGREAHPTLQWVIMTPDRRVQRLAARLGLTRTHYIAMDEEPAHGA